MYEYVPGPGIKLSRIAGLADDLAMSMEALRVRIVAPIPGKGAVGIEIPNQTRETVSFKEIVGHAHFVTPTSPITLALGKDIEGSAAVADLAKMPHLLMAGATGAGKSVSINAMIMSILFKATPSEVRMRASRICCCPWSPMPKRLLWRCAGRWRRWSAATSC
jgi:S-DNA-T family DNA segregation ATPase FtsK/SpoIIIE